MGKTHRKVLLRVAVPLFLMGVFMVGTAPLWAGSREDRIKAIEEKLAQLRRDSIEVREEALAAKAKLPKFRYRPGSGLAIRGAKKNWEFLVNIQVDQRWQIYLPTDGESASDFSPTQFSSTLRRFRMDFWYKRGKNLFWQYRARTNASNTGGSGTMGFQNAYLRARFDQWNPYYPMVQVSLRGGPSWFTIDANYGSIGGLMLERSIMIRGWINTTSSEGALGLNWRDKPLPGTPGTFRLSLFVAQEIGAASLDGNRTDTDDNKDILVSLGLLPWSKSKNKAIKKLHFGIGAVVGSVGKRDSYDRLRARVHSRGNRVDFWRQRTRGFRHWIQPYFEHEIGPYRVRTMWAIQRFRRDFTGGLRQDGGKHGLAGSTGWYIRQGLFLWSPKGGFLTGSTRTPGSVRFSVGFERLDINQGSPTHLRGGRFDGTTMHMLLRSFALNYFVARNFKVFTQYDWYSFSELRGLSTSRLKGLGCISSSGGDRGAGCDYGSIDVGFQYRF